jgi:hypothetical protein
MSLSRKNLGLVKNYSIDLATIDTNTFSIQVINLSDQTILADLPLDPMDNTLAAVLDKHALSKLGEDAVFVLKALSELLQEQIGAKEFVVLPTGADLPGYVPAQHAEFKRLRHASREDLEKRAFAILEQYSGLANELDKTHECVVGMPAIIKGLQHDKPYEEIFALLENHANFTVGKMTEYKDEDIQGKKARFNNSNVVPLAMLDSSQRLCGLIRVLSMGNKFGYLSDETINQEIIPAEKFPGSTVEEQKKNRSLFLLAYLTSKACALVKDQDHFLLIAAAGREDIYDAIGMQTFPIKSNDYVVTMKLGKPGPLLNSIKDKLIKPFSNVEAISKLGITPGPVISKTETNIGVQQFQGLNQAKK